MAQILLIEDDSNFALSLRTALRAEGYTVDIVGNGEAGLKRVREQNFDLILLDIKLPPREGHVVSEREGYGICEKLRREGNDTPVLMLTARNSEQECVIGFEAGADDYVSKPITLLTLLARIKALLHRANPGGSVTFFNFGDVEVNFRKGEVRRGGLPILMTHFEFKLLEVLIHNRGRVLSRDQLLSKVRGPAIETTARAIDNHIMNLRKKLEPNPKVPIYLVTVPGLGYRFDGLETNLTEI